jgi:hypothetical protein
MGSGNPVESAVFSERENGVGSHVCEYVPVGTSKGDRPSFGTRLRDTEEAMEVILGSFDEVGNK